MKSLSSKNKNVRYLLCVIYVFTKCRWIKPLKDKKGKTVLNTFIEIVNKSNRKPNKLWIDQGREFYNKLMQERLDNSDILMYSTHNEGTLKAQINKKTRANNSKSYLPYLNKLVDQYNNIYHHSINKNLLMLTILLQQKKLR